MACNCSSTRRTLLLVARNLTEHYPELLSLRDSFGWTNHPEYGALGVQVGAGCRFAGIAQVAELLQAVLEPARMDGVRAAWIDGDLPLAEQLSQVIHAEPVLRLVATDSTPLTDILAQRRIETWFQPVFRASDMHVWGYECLVRARTLSGDLISPADLLAWARQEQLIYLFDRVCRETHLRNCGRIAAPDDCKFLINFLPTAIYRPDYCLRSSLSAANDSGIHPSRVVFEVVETEKIEDREHLRSILEFYRKYGFQVALDDVGSGYAGLALLGDVNPDLIKIDRVLVAQAVQSPLHRSICEFLVRLGRENHRLVLAEGVETEEEHAVMTQLGVDLLQGFLFGRPGPLPYTVS
jgi:EAL domain-containing protein (putative c-di-GMP-specific phosphodiesterase class I)